MEANALFTRQSPPCPTRADPRVSQTIFQGLGCTQLDEDEWWLTVDYQIACSADGWSPMLLPCAVLTILIPVGIPVGMLVVLLGLKAELKTSHSHARDKYGFFVGEYNVRHFYWAQRWFTSYLS